MRNHTCTHVLNSVLHSLLPVTCQRSSLVTSLALRLDFAAFSADVDTAFLREVETRVLEVIHANLPVSRSVGLHA